MKKKSAALLMTLVMIAVLLPFIPSAKAALADGYYLIRPGWSVDAIDPGEAFRLNPNNSSEYMLDTTLTPGDSFKVVRVENNAIAQWFPEGTGNEYQVNDSTPHGDVRIYFLPGQGNFWVRQKFSIERETVLEGGTYIVSHESAPEGETITVKAIPEEGYLNDQVTVTSNGGNVPVSGGTDGIYTFAMPAGTATITVSFKQILEDGYYLIGVIPSICSEGWTINDIQKGGLFELNEACTAGPEYILTGIVLGEGDLFKIVQISDNSIAAWYPDGGDPTNYFVNDAHAGERIIYFRPAGRDDDYWSYIDPPSWDYFYVAPRNEELTDDRYYLIGPEWAATDVDPEELFFPNPDSTGEYILLTSREQNAEIKVVRVDLDHAVTAWYPDGYYNQHYVLNEEAGDEVIYFRPDGNNDWDSYYFYIGPPHYITVETAEGGTVTVTAADERYLKASTVYTDEGSNYRRTFTFAGAVLTVTATPEDGWELESVTVENDGNEMDLVDLEGDSFVMPDDIHVRVKAVFTQTEVPTSEPETSEPETSEPATSEPATSEPATSEPATSEPATSEPETSEPVTSEPETSEPATSGGPFTISFDPSGGTINGSTDPLVLTCDYGETITIPDEPVFDGRVFVCWQGSEYYPGDQYTVTGDHSFKALWEEVPGTADKSSALPWAAAVLAGLGVLCAAAAVRRKKESEWRS